VLVIEGAVELAVAELPVVAVATGGSCELETATELNALPTLVLVP